MSEAVTDPQQIPLLKYRDSPKVSLNPKVHCPFCLKAVCVELSALVTHIPNCLNYDYFKDGLPLSPASAIMIRADYSIAEYFEDEETYFKTLSEMVATRRLADAPTDDVDTLLDYIASFVSLVSHQQLTDLRRKSIAWRILQNLFEMNETAIEHMLGFLNTLSADDDANA